MRKHLCQPFSACLQYQAWYTVQACCLISINLLKHCSHLVVLEIQVRLSSWWADEWGSHLSLCVEAGKELVEDIRQVEVFTGQRSIPSVVRQCLDTFLHVMGVVVIELFFDVLFVFALGIPNATFLSSPVHHCRPICHET